MRGELDINGIFKKMKGYGFTVTTIAANGRRAAQEKCQHRNLWETVEMFRIHNVFFFCIVVVSSHASAEKEQKFGCTNRRRSS